MNDSFGGGMPATQGGGGGGQNEMKEGIGPVVIRQILESSPDGVKIFNFGFSMIKVVAFLRQIEETSTRIIYKLEDHTGQIDAHLWLDETSREKSDPRLKVNRYVSIVGSVRNNNGTKAIMLFKIAPVDGVNEVNTHLLEVLNTRYSAEDFSRKSNGLDVGQEPSTTSASSDNCGLTGKPLQVFKLIKENQSCEGISLQDLYKKLPKFSQQEIMGITDNMVLEGHVYTSIDSEHFLCTDP